VTDKHLEQDDFDRLITRELSRLTSFAPARGFENRVMAHVRLPDPKAVIVFRRARAWALQPRRALALAGAYAACAAIALGVAVPWVVQHAPSLSYGAGLALAKVTAAASNLGMTLAGWVLASHTYEVLRSLPVGPEHLVPLAALLTVAYAAAGVALHRLLKSPGGKSVPVTRSL
jgi:hypothetical protein